MDKIDMTRAMLPPRGVKARITEQNDTQNAIDMRDPEREHHGKKRDADRGETIDIYEDLAEVSIDLLRNFLQGLLETKDKMRETRRNTPPPSYAMQAYQTAGSQSHTTNVNVGEDAEVAGFSRLDLAAEALDKNEIQTVIAQLDRLAQNGVSYLSMERSDSFLQSIRDAIARSA